MRRVSVVVLVVAIAVVVASAACAQPESVTLQLKGVPGSQLTYDSTMSFQMDMTMPNPADASKAFTISPSFSGSARTQTLVKKVADNGDMTCGTKVDSFIAIVDVADFHLQLGIYGGGARGAAGGGQRRAGGGASRRVARGLVPAELLKLPELPVQTVMDKRGKLLEIQGLSGLIPPIPGPQGKKINIGDYITKVVGQFAQPMFPDKPVSVGDTWETKMVVDPGQMIDALGVPMPPEAKQQMAKMKFPIEMKSTLAGFEQVGGVECAKIEVIAPWQLDMPVSPPPGGQGEPVALRESGTTKVTLWFDHVAGRTVKQVTEISMEMKVSSGPTVMSTMTMKGNGETSLVQ
jgi:hypothetical protein